MTKKMTLKQKEEQAEARKKAKAAKSKKAKPAKKARAIKPPKEDAGILGHNSGMVNKAMLADIESMEALIENGKEINKALRSAKQAFKDTYTIQTNVLNEELKRRKMDADVRAQFENGLKDLEDMIGYQMSMNLVTGADEEGEGEEEQESDPESAAADAGDGEGDGESLAAGSMH